MAPRQAKPDTRKVGRQPSLLKDQGSRPQGIKKERPQLSSRKSARLENIERRQDRTKDTNTEPKHLPSPASNTPGQEACHRGFPQNPWAPLKSEDRKRRRPQESENPPIGALLQPARKRLRTSITSSVAGDTPGQEAAIGITENNPIDCWRRIRRWPKEYFVQDDQARKDFNKDFEEDSWYEKFWVPETNMNHLLARRKSSSSLRGKQSEASSAAPSSAAPSSTTPSDQKPREAKSTPYQDPRYKTILATKGSYIDESGLGITDKSQNNLQTLLSAEQQVPHNSLFRDDLFKSTCRNIQDRNETRVIRDISLLIVPSAETLAIYGATNLQCLIESTNEGWNNSIPITKTRPQPDYSIGFRREAFTEDQLKRLGPFVGDLTDTSFFMATYYMYFPFLTCEVKCGAAALDIADRQNAHSMTIAVRGVVELFRLVKRENELNREILAFSLSHDHRTVRIYGHYPIIDGSKTTFYRHPIHTFDFTALGGKEKWTAYKFTKSIYNIWMPDHFKRICSVIDELPLDLDFEVSQQPELQELESHYLSNQSSQGAASLEEAGSQSSRVGSRDVTPDTSLVTG